MTATVTFIVTCKGRLAHLKQSLPALVRQPDSEVIVVDSNCPDGAGEWVEGAFPQVRVVRHHDDGTFVQAVCRNQGLARATTPWVAFVDADVLVNPRFMAHVGPLLRPGAFFLFQACKGKRGLYGSVLVERERVLAAGGYDEAFRGFGGEDRDMYQRLESAGATLVELPHELVDAVIQHEGRTRFHTQKDTRVAMTVAGLYRTAKNDLLRVQPEALESLEARRRLFELAERTVAAGLASGGRRARLSLDIPPPASVQFFYATVRRQICIEVDVSKIRPPSWHGRLARALRRLLSRASRGLAGPGSAGQEGLAAARLSTRLG